MEYKRIQFKIFKPICSSLGNGDITDRWDSVPGYHLLGPLWNTILIIGKKKSLPTNISPQ